MLIFLGALPDWIKFIFILIVFAVIYVIYTMIHYRRVMKQILKKQNELKPGDFVLTQSGLYGVLKSVGENVVRLQIADNLEIVVDRFSIKERVVDEKVRKEAAIKEQSQEK